MIKCMGIILKERTREIMCSQRFFNNREHNCMKKNHNNPLNLYGTYCVGALRTAITSCFIDDRITEQEINYVKEVISKFRESEIENSSPSSFDKEEVKSQWKQWLAGFDKSGD